MRRDVRSCTIGYPCAILSAGRTVLPDTALYDTERYLLDERRGLTLKGRYAAFSDLSGNKPQFGFLGNAVLVPMAINKFESQTGIRSRYIFEGTLTELAVLAAKDALDRSGLTVNEIDAIIVGTNTPDEYNIANGVKAALGIPCSAYCVTMMAACPVGASIVYEAWQTVRLGDARNVLVIGAERGTTLASRDEYRSANLFGDAAGAMILGRSQTDNFLFFDYASDPYDGKIEWIRKAWNGFTQDGKRVHKYVGDVLPNVVTSMLTELDIDPATLNHVFPHQASAKTNELFEHSLRQRWPGFHGRFHSNVASMGNTSAASTPWMIGQAWAEHQLISGQRCLVLTFGAGMSYSFYAFTVP